MADDVVTTEKDAARLAGARFASPGWRLRVELEVTRGAGALEAILSGVVPATASPAKTAP